MKFKVGDKVKHKDFGLGKIIYIDEEMTAMPYAVQFKIFNNEMWCEEGNLELDKQHSLIPQIAKMLGVEIGERFSLKEYPENYYILDAEIGLCEIMGDGKHSRNFILGEIVIGKYTVRKLPKKPILTEDEKVILENLTKEYKYVARDYCGTLYVYKNKPKKDGDSWWVRYIDYSFDNLNLFKHLFQFIKWEDSAPYKIQELLEEYENLRSE